MIASRNARREAPLPAEPAAIETVRADSMLAMADLLMGVLHDLNSPLGAVLAQAEVLRERFPLGRDRTAAERITRAAGRLAALTRSYARASGCGREEPSLVCVNELAEETLLLFSHSLLARGVNLERRFSPDLPGLFARPRAVRMLLVALLGPALEAAGQAPPAGLELVIASPRPRCVRIELACPGRRLDASFEPRVYGPDPTRPSLYLAIHQARGLGGVFRVQEDRIQVDLPIRFQERPSLGVPTEPALP